MKSGRMRWAGHVAQRGGGEEERVYVGEMGWGGVDWIGLVRLRIGTSGELLSMR
jgi:hypothetical protein